MEDNKSLPTDTLTSGPTSTTFVISHGILFCCLAAFTVAAMCLLGWMLEIDALKRTVPGSVYMNPATASLILLISIAIYLSSKFEGRYTTVLKVSGALALFVGIAKLSNGIFGLDLGIDRLVFSGQLFDKILQQPSQMSQLSAMIIAMFGTALILHRSEKPDRWHLRSVVQILAVVVHLTAMLGLISFLYGVRTFHLVFTIDPMALHSSICFAVLSIGLLLSQPDKGVMGEILSRDVGGEMTRRIMLPVLLTPPSLGFLLLAGFKLQMFSPEIGIALFVIVTVVILMVVILTNAYAMNQQARTRRVAEVALEVAMRREALIVEHALDVICTLDENGRFLTVNPACRRLLG